MRPAFTLLYRLANYYSSDISFGHLARDLIDDLAPPQEQLIKLTERETMVAASHSQCAAAIEEEVTGWQNKLISDDRWEENNEES